MSRIRILGIMLALLLLAVSFFSVTAQRRGGNLAPNPTNTPTPIPDNDGDGVPNHIDNCPNQAGLSSNMGCPENNGNNGGGNNGGGNNGGGNNGGSSQPSDIDGDGIGDSTDNCPTVPGVAENQGCPNTITVTPPPRPDLSTNSCEVATDGTQLVNIRGDESTNNPPIGSLDPYRTYPALGIIGDWVQLVDGGFVYRPVVRVSAVCPQLDRSSDSNRSVDDLTNSGNPENLGDAICVYFTGMFRNSSDSTKALIIELTDAMGEGSSNHIGPALVEPGETYFAERHFLVSDDWQAPIHPSEGWRIITLHEIDSEEINPARVTHPQLLPDYFDFSVVGDVNFLLTFREDCTSPQPVCYHATATLNNTHSSASRVVYIFTLTRNDMEVTAGSDENIAFIITDESNTYAHNENTPLGQETHQFYILTPWHFDSIEHQGLSLELFIVEMKQENPDGVVSILEISEVSEVPIESIDHPCETNPVELRDTSDGMADGFATDQDAMVCYYFEQSFLNTTDLTIESPAFQLVVRVGSSFGPVFQALGEPFSATIFTGGTNKLQHLFYGSEFSYPYYVSAEMNGQMPEGLQIVGPELLMIVDNDYCDSGIPPFTHDELVENGDASGACYIVSVAYQNGTANQVDIGVQLTHVLLDSDGNGESTVLDSQVLTWNPGNSGTYSARFWLNEIPNGGYISYKLGSDTDASSFTVNYDGYHACVGATQAS